MTESKIPELLQKLEKLDPAINEEFDRLLGEVIIPDGNDIHDRIRAGSYILLGVIQDAIEAKGGWIRVEGPFRTSKKPYQCCICTNGHNGEIDTLRRGTSRVEAILAAYVAVLEAEAMR